MTIRTARPGDADGICALTNDIIRNTLITFTTDEKTPDMIRADIAARGPAYLVAEDAGGVAGFATYGPFRGGPGYAHSCEHSIQLTPRARGQGLGRALMDQLQDIARGEGKHVMIAGISGENPAAIAFHTRLGFTQSARMAQVGRKQDRWLDLILMQKILHLHPDTDARTR